ncbi:hypothetical protein PV05_06002 [Exophiala xenobiotica]|uniref:FAD-binding PCMH-type domain-containing protein n=1 Tax=Exophiala xenobiotica TaxID=348802 RepID=A0A0D2BYF4_9EURO|nr:uncharacterized protein PV05_06002 [Exophiala xenobiotica]KIW57451.1 hypothetical protein PV05_06002 [Exophiala xenobiotica]
MVSTHNFTCQVVIPNGGQALHDVVSRWSDTYIDLPAIVVKPDSEADIVDAIKYAKDNSLTLVTANGSHAPFVPVTSNTLYLDMTNFNGVTVDQSADTVRIGGGASTGEVIKGTTAQGYYTLWPNSDAVGYVGCLLGGGSDTMNGLHGFMIDAVESMQLITTDGVRLEISPSSEGNERTLFNALCGAGFGLAVITSVVMKAFRISRLRLTDNSIWTRRVVLPASAILMASRTFVSMQQLPQPLSVSMICLRSPPNAQTPGAPLIMITGSYFGPSEEGEEVASALFADDLISQALSARTDLVPFADANLALKPLSAHGDYKSFSSTLLDTIDVETIVTGFHRWLRLGEQYEDARPTSLVFNKWDTKVTSDHGQTDVGRGKFFEHRNQGMLANAMCWCASEETRGPIEQFGDEFLKIMRRNSSGQVRCIANNLRPGMDLGELYSGQKLEELRKLKVFWDPYRILWSPW